MPRVIPPEQLFRNNAEWVSRKTDNDPQYFARLAAQQAPDYLWIGCSDSRVPANDIVGLDPGELFVHRNVANLVVASDLNLLSVLQFAVEILKVRHVAVTGHYGCGGVRAALSRVELGLIDNWLQPIKQISLAHRDELEPLDEEARVNRLCELNVVQQVRNVASTTVVQNAWARGQELQVHGWIYAIEEGRLRNLDCTLTSAEQLEPALRVVVPRRHDAEMPAATPRPGPKPDPQS
jgi:carbonic anhydrase